MQPPSLLVCTQVVKTPHADAGCDALSADRAALSAWRELFSKLPFSRVRALRRSATGFYKFGDARGPTPGAGCCWPAKSPKVTASGHAWQTARTFAPCPRFRAVKLPPQPVLNLPPG